MQIPRTHIRLSVIPVYLWQDARWRQENPQSLPARHMQWQTEALSNEVESEDRHRRCPLTPKHIRWEHVHAPIHENFRASVKYSFAYWVCICRHTQASQHACRGQGTLGVGSLFLLCGLQGLNSSCQAWLHNAFTYWAISPVQHKGFFFYFKFISVANILNFH